MSKVKSSDISHYELLYFIPNKFTEEEIKPMIEQVGKIITNKRSEEHTSELQSH